jgi:hypothetical protein
MLIFVLLQVIPSAFKPNKRYRTPPKHHAKAIDTRHGVHTTNGFRKPNRIPMMGAGCGISSSQSIT